MSTDQPINASLGPIDFDRCFYDEDEDALYLHRGEPRPALTWESPEGYLVRIDPITGELVGVTIFDYVRSGIGEEVGITLPRASDLSGRIETQGRALRALEALGRAVGVGRPVECLVNLPHDHEDGKAHLVSRS